MADWKLPTHHSVSFLDGFCRQLWQLFFEMSNVNLISTSCIDSFVVSFFRWQRKQERWPRSPRGQEIAWESRENPTDTFQPSDQNICSRANAEWAKQTDVKNAALFLLLFCEYVDRTLPLLSNIYCYLAMYNGQFIQRYITDNRLSWGLDKAN